jgi:hypothetical protein
MKIIKGFLISLYLVSIMKGDEKVMYVKNNGAIMNDEEYLSLLKPKLSHLDNVKAEAERLAFSQTSNKWISKILAKIDNMKFIVNRRLEQMGENVANRIKNDGINPVYEYQRVYNSLMNPLTNPYLQMQMTNTMMAPPEMTRSGQFGTFQNNLKNFADVYAKSIAFLKAGLFQNPKEKLVNYKIHDDYDPYNINPDPNNLHNKRI